jgi:hypothetical protein
MYHNSCTKHSPDLSSPDLTLFGVLTRCQRDELAFADEKAILEFLMKVCSEFKWIKVEYNMREALAILDFECDTEIDPDRL